MIREIPGLQMAGGEKSILRKYHCVSPGSLSFLAYLLLTLREKLLRDGLWDCSWISFWTERIKQTYPVYPSFSGVKCTKKILIKIIMAKKYVSSCPQNLFHAKNSRSTKKPQMKQTSFLKTLARKTWGNSVLQ